MADKIEVAQRVRLFLRALFGSRVTALLEEEILRIRADYELRLNERDETISELRSRVAQQAAKLETWEMVLIPLVSPAANLFKPKHEPTFESTIEPSGWAAVKAQWDREQAELAKKEAAERKNDENAEQVQNESGG